MYRTITRNIAVTVTPRFLPERSSPDTGYWFWAYTIEIANEGTETVQLKTRHWRITDAFGRLQEVRGAGVVGEEPVLGPGEWGDGLAPPPQSDHATADQPASGRTLALRPPGPDPDRHALYP